MQIMMAQKPAIKITFTGGQMMVVTEGANTHFGGHADYPEGELSGAVIQLIDRKSERTEIGNAEFDYTIYFENALSGGQQ